MGVRRLCSTCDGVEVPDPGQGQPHLQPFELRAGGDSVALGETRADPQVLWWGPLSLGLILAFVILTGSVVITRRVGQGYSASFWWKALRRAWPSSPPAVIRSRPAGTWVPSPAGATGGCWSPRPRCWYLLHDHRPQDRPANRLGPGRLRASVAAVGALIISTQSGEFGTKVGILADWCLRVFREGWIDRRFDGDGLTCRSHSEGPRDRSGRIAGPRRCRVHAGRQFGDGNSKMMSHSNVAARSAGSGNLARGGHRPPTDLLGHDR